MRKEITIGDKTVEVAANGATPIIHKKIFGADLLRGMQQDPEDFEQYIELTFTMAQQAVVPGSDLMKGKVKEEDFVAWLEQFEMMDLIEAVTDVLAVYQASRKGGSVPKNPAD